MPAILRIGTAENGWETVELCEGVEIELQIGSPTAADQITAQAMQAVRAGLSGQDRIDTQRSIDRLMLSSTVTGWRGVETEDGEPVPFSEESLLQLIGQYGCYARLLNLAYRAFYSRPGDAAKNSDAPPSGGSGERQNSPETNITFLPSNSGGDSAESENSPAPSE